MEGVISAADVLREWFGEKDFMLLHTSGSTGTPKEIRMPKEAMRASAQRTNRFFGIGRESLLCCCVGLRYVGGKMMAVRAVEAGCECIFLQPSNTPALPSRRVDLLSCVPSQLPFILDAVERGSFSVRALLIGGAPLPESLRRRCTLLGVEAYESYGMTETASHVALRRTDEPHFRPLPGIRVGLQDGCLAIEGAVEERVVTNDLGELHEAGGFTVTGRADDAIITGGLKLHPAEVERLIAPLMPEGAEFMVTSRPDAKWGERVVLATTKRPDAGRLRSVLEGWMMPKEIVVVERVPQTASGKPWRAEMRRLVELGDFRDDEPGPVVGPEL